jgi:glycolate oxidase iron-sulfur subunit
VNQPDRIIPPTEEQYLNCIRCGLCLSVCPTYRENLTETASPRARVALARKGLEGDLALSPNLNEQMLACFDCLACNDICPVGIRPADLALEMRSLLEQRNPSAWKKTIFRDLLPHPARLEAAALPLVAYQRLGLSHLAGAGAASRLLPPKLRDLNAMLPSLPARPLRRVLPEISRAVGEEKIRVGFFLGCVQSLVFASESAATVRVLNRNGCTVITPSQTVCCGMPALAFGLPRQAWEQAQTNIDLFERSKVDVIVTDCATCGSALKDYSSLLANDPQWAQRAAAFSARVRDVSEFLMSIPLEKPGARIEQRVTYHDPCHLRRAQKIWEQPRAILKMIDGLDFVELPEADWCCGSAGTQLLTHYETSSGVLKRKTANISATRADLVASGCPACRMQLKAGLGSQGTEVQVLHPVTLLDMAYADGMPLRGAR